MSYDHAADGRLAPALQKGLQRLAKPWHRRRALHVFRDETGLATNPHLWSSIEAALEESSWFALLASPEAAASEWVDRELTYWVERRDPERILPVVTDGTWIWDADAGKLAPDSTAVPPALRELFKAEPRHLDLRWVRDEAQLDLLDPKVWTRRARKMVGRNFSREEWDEQVGGGYRRTCARWPAG